MTQRIFRLTHLLLAAWLTLAGVSGFAQAKPDYPLGAGDSIRIQVFQNPDLTVETRVSENGSITYPLIGAVDLGGLSIAAAEKKIADALQKGGFIRQPQVNIVLTQIRGNQVSVLGQVNRPGRFPLETANARVPIAAQIRRQCSSVPAQIRIQPSAVRNVPHGRDSGWRLPVRPVGFPAVCSARWLTSEVTPTSNSATSIRCPVPCFRATRSAATTAQAA